MKPPKWEEHDPDFEPEPGSVWLLAFPIRTIGSEVEYDFYRARVEYADDGETLLIHDDSANIIGDWDWEDARWSIELE